VSENPFVGLRPFKQSEAAYLFGRDDDLTLVFDRIMSANTMLLFAPSGVGKTSFLNAKLIPQVARRYAVVTCQTWGGGQPKRSILEAIAGAIRSHEDALSYAEALRRIESAIAASSSSATAVTLAEAFRLIDWKRCLLLLDQFEEVFHATHRAGRFYAFLQELTEMINDERLRVRVLFSMREEYLGELSIFDNRIPDLFHNHYRLKHPSRDLARSIVQGICREKGVQVDPAGLTSLIADLAKIRRNTPLGGGEPSNYEGDTVTLPSLQLVCQRLWTEDIPAGRAFLASYSPGRSDQVRNEFTDQTLGSLTPDEQRRMSRALDYLITKGGAKMAWPLDNLSVELGQDMEELGRTLRRLSGGDTRILQENHEPDGSVWFELSHDMYAPFLNQWKEDLRRREEKLRGRDVAVWERQLEPLDEFWVYLPEFLAGADESIAGQIVDVMATNLTKKNTRYLYIVESAGDVERLFHLVERLKHHPLCADIDPASMVRVLVLAGTGANGVAEAVSGLLHVGNCWIANPYSDQPQGYEVEYDERGERPVGGRRLPVEKMNRIIRNVRAIVKAFPPASFADVHSAAEIPHLVDQSPWIAVERPNARSARPTG
jgi:hypothetical protein